MRTAEPRGKNLGFRNEADPSLIHPTATDLGLGFFGEYNS